MLEMQDAPNKERNFVSCTPQSSNGETRIDAGKTSNDEDLNPVICDTARTTCWTEADSKVTSTLNMPLMPTEIERRKEGIEEFLSKPYLLSALQYTTSTAANTNLAVFDPHAYLSSVTQWANKIQGFGLVRGTFVLRVEITAYPFQSGKLLIHALPNYNEMLNSTNPNLVSTHNTLLVSKFQHPYIELDLRDSVAEFKFPYIAPTSFYDIKNGGESWGRIFLDSLTPLRTGSGGLTFAEVACYGYWEDFSLAAPTVPQSSQMEKREVSGPISSGLKKVSRGFSDLSKIAVLSPVMQPLAWVLNIASGVASVFGWSKPRLDQPPMVMVKQLARYIGTSDGPDVSVPTSVTYDNAIEVMDKWSITKEDEMSMKFLLSIPTYMSTISWTTGNASGTSLLSQKITPKVMYTEGTDTHSARVATYRVGAPFYYLSNFFRYWRGDVWVVLKFAKTQYHSGKLQITWTPGSNITTAPTLATSILSYRHIVDIRDQNEVRFNLPWQLAKCYLKTGTTTNEVSGQLDIVVLTDLRAPETCSSTIDMLVFYLPGDNFEFQVPGPSTGITTGPYLPQSSQSEVLVSGGIAETKINSASTYYSKMCIGEHILSIKQMLNKCTQLYPTRVPIWVGSKVLNISPFVIGAESINPSTGILTESGFVADAFSIFAPMYAYCRGSTRFFVSQDGPTSASGVGQPHLIGMNTPDLNGQLVTTNAVTTTAVATGQSAGQIPSILTGIFPLQTPLPNDLGVGLGFYEIPYYSRYPVTHPLFAGGSQNVGYTYEANNCSVFTLQSYQNFDASLQIYRSMSDNFVLSYFIGCPPLLITYL